MTILSDARDVPIAVEHIRQYALVTDLLGEVSSEGGPFLILDRNDAEAWRGSLDERHYSETMTVPFMTGAFEFDGRAAVVWEAEGAATAMVYRLAPDRLVVQREWADEAETPERSDSAEEFASVEFGSGNAIVMWAPVAWEDIWEPPAPGSEAQLSMPSMLNVGLQVVLPRGIYSLASERRDDAIRCWFTRRP